MQVISGEGYSLHEGDCLDVLRTFEDNTFDTVITDPPAGISFMGKEWDGSKGGRARWIAWLSEVMAECLRVAKPGAMMLCWSIPRTSHWTGTAIEQAGWEVRDVITFLFGSGFPKGHDISKAIDRMAGIEHATNGAHRPEQRVAYGRNAGALRCTICGNSRNGTSCHCESSMPATDAAREWAGYNVALKPAAEFWWLAMKPLDGTFAHNAVIHGVAGLNIDGCRIGTSEKDAKRMERCNTPGSGRYYGSAFAGEIYGNPGTAEGKPLDVTQGRWPANLVLDTEAARLLDEMSGEGKSPASYIRSTTVGNQIYGKDYGLVNQGSVCNGYGDHGGASRFFTVIDSEESRFFYSAKASRSERDQGTEDGNVHPTVKPLSLMRHFVKLTRTPKGGSVLDPFCGSGSTGVACMIEGRSFVGIDSDPGSIELSHHRIEHWRDEVSTEPRKIKDTVTHTDLPLFMELA